MTRKKGKQLDRVFKVRMDDELYDKLDDIAKMYNITKAEIVRRFIEMAYYFVNGGEKNGEEVVQTDNGVA